MTLFKGSAPAFKISVLLVVLLFSKCNAAEFTSVYETAWDCQLPGPCSFCPLCNNCQEGPEGTPGGCGICKFCSPVACSQPECVGGRGATIATTADGVPPPATETATASAVNANVKGRILVLDVNSWDESDGAEKLPRVVTAAQCAKVCQLTSGCNAWTFCYKPEGCGMANECKTTEQEAINSQKRCSAFGPFGKCTADGKYPFLMCSLKTVDSESTTVEALEYYPNGTDWTSGVIPVNAQAAPSVTARQDEAFPISQKCQV